MRAFIVESHGGPEALHLSERALPQPGPSEARVRVRAVGLNHLDLWVRRGVPGHKFPLPLIPGSDIVGTVTALGPGTSDFQAGDPVLVAPGHGCGRCSACLAGEEQLCRHYVILGEMCDGGCAEEAVVPSRSLMAIPRGLSLAEAASLPLSLLTAWHMLVHRAKIRPGETILIQAGGSGVGVMAIQIARLFGATILTTVGSRTKAELARGLGAEHVLLYKEVDFADEVRRITGKRGVDVVLDHVGGETFERSVRVVAKGGRLVTCGATAGAEVRLDLRVVFFKSLSLLGSTMGSRGELGEAMKQVEAGRIRPVVHAVYPMEELPRAHEALEARSSFGKIVVSGFGVSPEEIRSPRA